MPNWILFLLFSRFYAIYYPLSRKCSTSLCWIAISLIWTLSLIISFPWLIYFDVVPMDASDYPLLNDGQSFQVSSLTRCYTAYTEQSLLESTIFWSCFSDKTKSRQPRQFTGAINVGGNAGIALVLQSLSSDLCRTWNDIKSSGKGLPPYHTVTEAVEHWLHRRIRIISFTKHKKLIYHTRE